IIAKLFARFITPSPSVGLIGRAFQSDSGEKGERRRAVLAALTSAVAQCADTARQPANAAPAIMTLRLFKVITLLCDLVAALIKKSSLSLSLCQIRPIGPLIAENFPNAYGVPGCASAGQVSHEFRARAYDRPGQLAAK